MRGETWDLITGKVMAEAALPVVDIMTMAATGGEFDDGCVISRTETNDKFGYNDPHLFPAASILDPTYTVTISKRQTAAGVSDAMNHTIEQYFAEDTTLLNDGICKANLRSLMTNVKIVLEDPENYRARAEIFQCCAYGCNGILSLESSYSGWPCHGIEHARSACCDITHGIGLAILTPRWMRHILSEHTLPRFVKFAVNVMGVEPGEDDRKTAEEGIEALYRFFESIGIPMHFREVGIDESRIEEMAEHVVSGWLMTMAYVPLTKKNVTDIFRASLS